jgi:hypothetical protein
MSVRYGTIDTSITFVKVVTVVLVLEGFEFCRPGFINQVRQWFDSNLEQLLAWLLEPEPCKTKL